MSYRKTSRKLAVSVAVSVFAAATVLAAVETQSLQVTPLTREGHVMVSFTLTEGFTDEVKDAIHSGLMTTFAYEVDMKRGASYWFDRTVASASVSASVKYDTLTRKFSVTRSRDGRMDSAESTDNEAVVRDLLTKFDRLPLFSSAGLEPNAEYYLRVRAHTSPRTSWAPWALLERRDVAGIAKFTFIP